MRFIESDGFLLLENNRIVWSVVGQGPSRPVRTCFRLSSIGLDGRNRVAVELRFSDDQVYPPAGTIVAMVILPASAFLARLICACVPLGRLFISPGRAVGIQDEVFYASDLREVASEEFCG